MAYSNAPQQSTEQTKSIPLFYKWDSRDASLNSYDTLRKNSLIEAVGHDYYQVMKGHDYYQLIKRDGLENVGLTLPGSTIAGGPTTGGGIMGMYYWQRNGLSTLIAVAYLSISGTTIIAFYDAFSLALVGSTTGPGAQKSDVEVGFQDFLYQNGNVDLIVTAGTDSRKIDQTALTSSVLTTGGAAVPLVYMDGYLWGSNGTAVLNSNLNDPTTWSASNFLNADSYPDPIVRIARVGTYIVAFGSTSIQYFYDAANPTGTPLGANVGATKRIGYIGGLANSGDDVFFIGTENQGPPQLFQLTGLQCKPLTSAPFSRFWTGAANKQASNSVAPIGSILILKGHTCYYVRTNSVPFSVPPPITPPVGDSYIFDLDTQEWSKIGYQGTEYMLLVQSLAFSSNNTPIMSYVGILNDTNMYRFNPNVYQDNGVNFEVKFRTSPQSFMTKRIKFGSRLVLDADQTPTTSLCNLSWSDDDYQTVSGVRSVDLSNKYQQLYSLGSFRRRGFIISYSDNFPMRWRTIELDYDLGEA